jgi:LemA protein
MESRVYPAGPGHPPGLGDRRSSGALWLVLLLGVVALLGAGALVLWSHNDMLGRAEAVDAAWAQVESNYQRRADLVPRLVETVNRYVRHEEALLLSVAKERTAAQRAVAALEQAHQASAVERRAGPGKPPGDPAQLTALAQREAEVGRSLRAVLAVAEAYPELRSADQFLELQAQLEGTENRINIARMAFNDAVRAYNAALVQIPTRFVAESRGLERRPYFEADAGAKGAGPLGLE